MADFALGMDVLSIRKRTEDLKQLKQIVRSVIEANGNRISIGSLVKEYKKITQNDIPVTSLGFYSVLQLIQECDDWFGVQRCDTHRTECEYIVYCLPDNNTKHLVDLIQNQRYSEDCDKIVLRPRINFNPFRIQKQVDQRPKQVKPFQLKVMARDNAAGGEQKESEFNCGPLHLNLNGKKNTKSLYKPVCPLPDTRIITNEVKSKITALMRHFKTLSLMNFEIIYKRFHSQPLNCQLLGYASVDQLLKAIPDVIRFEDSIDGPKICLNELEEQAHKIVKDSNQKRQPFKSLHIESETRSNSSIVNRNTDMNNIRRLLKSQPKGVEVGKFIDLYQTTYKKSFACEQWGYSSPIEMFAKMRDVFILKRLINNLTNNDEWLLFEHNSEIETNETKTIHKKKRFGSDFKQNVNQLMLKISKTKPKQINVEDFNTAYYMLFREKIEPKTYGFDSWRKLLLELSKECNFDVKERIKNQPFLVFIKKT